MKRADNVFLILSFIVFLSLSVLAETHALAQTDIDTDGDLMPDQWEINNGFDPNNPSDAELDPDSDRLTNRDEFFAGTDPTVYTAASSMTEKQLLDLFAGKAFLYFWEQSRPDYYFTADNANYNNPANYSSNFNSIATTGFGMMAYVVADDRGWVNHVAAYERIRTLLSRAVTMQQPAYDKIGVPPNQQGNRHGYLYHFVDDYGLRYPGSEISTIDHALFVAGALVAAEYYKGTEVEELARQLYSNTDWNWLYNGTFLYQGWIEDSAGAYEGGRTLDSWNRYSEFMILLFLAMGSGDASMSIPPSAWDALTYGTGRMFPYEYAHLFPGDGPQNFAFVPNMPNTIQEPGYNNSAAEFHYIHAGSLHNHQYSHLFADFRARRDRWQTDYFANSISATMANRQYCVNLNSHAFGGDPSSPDQYMRQPYETYGPNSWGIMAGIPSFTGYAVLQPIVMSYDNFSPDNIARNNDSGTVLLSAPLGSTPFTPRQTIDFTRNMLTRFQANEGGYDALVGRYGFMNSFNLGRPYNSSQVGHFATNIIGLDMGPVVGSVENYMSGLVWKMAMRNQFIQAGMQNAGFNTGVVEPFILNFDDNPPSPHEDPNGGGVDPNSFGGNSYRFGTGAISYAWIDDPFPSLPYGPQQWAQQISASDNIDSGAFIILKNHDVSRWDRLSFWIKGDTGAEEYSVGLKGSVVDRLGNIIQATEAKLPITRYHPDRAITSQWRGVSIPLRDFADKGVRLTALDNISFTNTKADGGTIYIDDIAFLGDEFKPSAPQGLLETISGNSITLYWDANPEPDVVGYRIYRSDDQGATFNLINTHLIVPMVYIDANPSGRQHLYRITAVDNAQPANESDPSDTISVFINDDITPPAGSVNINNGASSTNTINVTLNLFATDTGSGIGEGSQMQFSNDNMTWSTPEPYAISKAWTLTKGNGTKTVYAKFKDVAGNWSGPIMDTITLQVPPPTVSVSVSPVSVEAGQPFTVTITGTSTVGLASVWWFVEDTNNRTFHTINGTVGGMAKNLAAAQDFGAGFGQTSYSYARTVTITDPGNYEIKANSRDMLYPVSGEAHQASEGAGIPVVAVNVAPQFNPMNTSYSVNEGQSLSFIVNASDKDGDNMTLSTLQSIPGSSFTSGQTQTIQDGSSKINGTLNWIPDYNQSGTYTVTFKVIDSRGGTAESSPIQITVLDVNRRPEIVYLQKLLSGALVWQGQDAEDGANLIYSYKVDMGAWTKPASGTTVTLQVLKNTFKLKRGTHTFSLKAIDKKGAESDIKSILFTI